MHGMKISDFNEIFNSQRLQISPSMMVMMVDKAKVMVAMVEMEKVRN